MLFRSCARSLLSFASPFTLYTFVRATLTSPHRISSTYCVRRFVYDVLA